MAVEVYEVPVEIEMAGLIRAYEIHVPTERGQWVQVDVLRNLVRDTYEVEFTAALLKMAPQALTATVQLVMLALQERADG